MQFYFSKQLKNGKLSTPKKILATSKEEAERILLHEFPNDRCIVSDTKKITLPTPPKTIVLDDRAAIVCEYVLESDKETVEGYLNNQGFSKKDYSDFCLTEGTHKKYYAYCFWDHGSNGSFCDEEEVEDLVQDSCTRRDDCFEYSIFNVDTKKNVSVHVKVSVKLEDED